MIRRSFFSAAASAVALSASAFHPAGAAESGPSFPEPDPIAVDQATVDRARRVLNGVASNTLDRTELAPELSSFVPPEFFTKGAAFVSALGAPQSMYPFEKRIMANETSTYFRVRYPKEILTWVFSVNDAGRIVGLSLRHSPNNLIFNAVYREIAY